jgi:carbon-monoxide dehydrogenase medium subunit
MRELQEYLRPMSPQEAVAAKMERGSRAIYLAGGTDVMVHRPRNITTVIDIMHMGLDFVREEHGTLVIGAAALLRDIERHPLVVPVASGMLTVAVRETGPWLIRNAATLCGNMCNASPAADSAPMLLALDTEMVLSDGRVVPLTDFFIAPHRTILTDELVVEMHLHPRGRRGYFHKLARSKSDIALVNLAVVAQVDGDTLHDVRIALGAVAPTPIRAYQSEALLERQRITQDRLFELEKLVRNEIRPISDWRTSAEYRRHTAGVLVRRAVEALLIEGQW